MRLRFYFIIVFCLGISSSINSQTYVSGNVAGFWEKSGNPYIVNDHISLPSDSSLYIYPGTQILFNGNYKFDIYGHLQAVGNKSDSIIFSRNHLDSTWLGLRFIDDRSNSLIKYSVIENCYNYSESDENNVGAINCNNSNVTIENSAIRYNSSYSANTTGGGIYCFKSNPLIYGNTISNNISWGGGGSGIHCTNSDLKILYNNISFNESRDIVGMNTPTGGGIASIQSSATIQNNLIYKNEAYEGGGIVCFSEPANKIINNTIVYNKEGVIAYHSPTIFINNIIFYNGRNEQIKNHYVAPILKNNNIENYYSDNNNNFYLDPYFVDIPSEDFHVNSYSPCIDAGNKESSYSFEPSYNGQRINIGAYGNTSEATQSEPGIQIITSALVFDTLAINQIQSIIFTIKSIGITRLNIDSIFIKEDLPYTIEYQGSKSLLHGDSSIIKITFNPKYPGDFNTDIKIINNVPDKEIITIPIFAICPFLNSPAIANIMDIPHDQGGLVFVDFTKSAYDSDSLQLNKLQSPEMYTVEINYGLGWVGVLSTVAYGKSEYSVMVPTNIDSTSEHDGKLSFRVIAGMEEGNFVSESKIGYSIDNLSPEVPSGLRVSLLNNSEVKLLWSPQYEKDFKYFTIYKKINGNLAKLTQTIDTVFIDSFTQIDQYCFYAISATDYSGNESVLSQFSEIRITEIEQETLVSTKYYLDQNYPNPFNPSTRIKYSILKSDNVTITLFDINGEKIKDLVNKFQITGTHEITWNGTNRINQQVSSGIYYYKINTGDFSQVKKMILLK